MKQLANRFLYLVFLISLLTACSQLGLQQAKSIEDNIQYGKAAVGSAYQTIGDLKSQGMITQAQGRQYLAKVEEQEKNVMLAESLLKGGRPVDANTTIDLALRALVTLRSELDARRK